MGGEVSSFTPHPWKQQEDLKGSTMSKITVSMSPMVITETGSKRIYLYDLRNGEAEISGVASYEDGRADIVVTSETVSFVTTVDKIAAYARFIANFSSLLAAVETVLGVEFRLEFDVVHSHPIQEDISTYGEEGSDDDDSELDLSLTKEDQAEEDSLEARKDKRADCFKKIERFLFGSNN